MNWLKKLFQRCSMIGDLSEEMRQHLDEKIEALVADGMPREEAIHTARRAFGNATLLEQRSREVWMWPLVESLWADIKFALRQLRKSPGFTLTAILTLAVGIGANTAIFTLMNALLLRSLPVQDPDRLVRLAMTDTSAPKDRGGFEAPTNYPIIKLLQERAHALQGVFGWSSYTFVLKEDGAQKGYSGAMVGGNAFQVLGVRPAAGRLLNERDDQSGGGPDGWAAVISHAFWIEHYHGDPSVVGRHVTLTDHSVTIVGVAPQGFDGILVGERPDFYLPLYFEPVIRGAGSQLLSPADLWLTTMARQRPDVSRQQTAAELTAIWPGILDALIPPKFRHTPLIEHSALMVMPGRTGWSFLRTQWGGRDAE